MVTNYQHAKIRNFALLLGIYLGLMIGMFVGQALTLRTIQKHGGCIAMPVEQVLVQGD